ncbi:MAG TPA: RlpA-like double-psi beta-barrel domain-containing protein [Solirubrobacteraceae bacterium]|nr:RlpA-like double-psi beta-barrel domain-containing protein [Solirubrobacteraceae bacterium]
MDRRLVATLCAALAAAGLLAVPVFAGASPTGAAQAPERAPALEIAAGAIKGQPTTARGEVDAPGVTVLLQRLDARTGWTTVATARAGADGAWSASWSPTGVGRVQLRAIVQGQDAARAASTGSTDVIVHRQARATWYGPGFYGRRTACGKRLTRSTLGVAHRTLPCGTKVSIFYSGRRIEVPVIDRGPFANGATFDLTAAAAKQLGFTQTAVIGALRIRP